MIADTFVEDKNMDMEHAILNYFTHKKIIDTLARYDLYYNISVLYIAHTAIDNDTKADEILSKLELQINPEIVLEAMYSILNEYHADEKLFTIFEENIKMQSCMKALDDFVHAYEEIPRINEFIQKTQSSIIMDQFFNHSMEEQFHNTLKENKEFWGKIIDLEAATQILHAVQNTGYKY